MHQSNRSIVQGTSKIAFFGLNGFFHYSVLIDFIINLDSVIPNGIRFLFCYGERLLYILQILTWRGTSDLNNIKNIIYYTK